MCDGSPHCHDDLDEPESCRHLNTDGLVISTSLLFSVYFVISFGRWFYHKYVKKHHKVQTCNASKWDGFQSVLRHYETNHSKKSAIDYINKYLIHINFTMDKLGRRAFSKQFYRREKKLHRNENEIFACLNATLAPINAKMVIQQNYPGFIERNLSCITDRIDKLQKHESVNKVVYSCKKIFSMMSFYMDLFKANMYVMLDNVQNAEFKVIYSEKAPHCYTFDGYDSPSKICVWLRMTYVVHIDI